MFEINDQIPSRGNLFTPSFPEKEEVTLTIVERFGEHGREAANFVLRTWTEYEYASNVEIPSDGWSFTLGAAELGEEVRPWIIPGTRVQLHVNGVLQGDGIIDTVGIRASRGQGTEFRIQGRDKLAQVVDACADPTRTFKEGMSLLDVLLELFGPFGWSNPDQFVISNTDNVTAKGGIRGIKQTKGGKKKGPHDIKSIVLHQLRPYPREGVFQFASRICLRHGLMIWASASGEKIIVGRPDFDLEPFYKLRRNAKGSTNVLDGEVTYSVANQATCIVADGASGGGEFGRSRIKSIMANTSTFTNDPAFIEPFARYPDAARVLGHAFATVQIVSKARTLYLHDEESHTQEQLNNFVRREMAHLQKGSLVAHYTVEGHGQNTDDGFIPWTVDTTVDVEDEIAGLKERMYILGRTFHKSRHAGTTTTLDLIRLHTIQLGEPPVPKPAPIAKPDGEIVRQRRELENIEEQETSGGR